MPQHREPQDDFPALFCFLAPDASPARPRHAPAADPALGIPTTCIPLRADACRLRGVRTGDKASPLGQKPETLTWHSSLKEVSMGL